MADGGAEQMKSNNNGGYACDLCPKSFRTLQALGGHQNAHRKERRAARSLENERKLPLVRQAEMERLLMAHWAAAAACTWPAPDPTAQAGTSGLPFGTPNSIVEAEPQVELDLRLKL